MLISNLYQTIFTEEQIFIVLAYDDPNWEKNSEEVKRAISEFKLPSSFVKSVVLKSCLFKIPYGSSPGATLNSDLIKQLQNSIGAIVFVDFLKPNVAYELGFFHGQGKPVLFVTMDGLSRMWGGISDLAGVALLDISKNSLHEGVLNYLDHLYFKLAHIPIIPLTEIPLKSKNNLKYLVEEKGDKGFIPEVYESDFGSAMTIETWGGLIIRPKCKILPDAKFKILLRSNHICEYSIYFFVHFINAFSEKRSIYVGVTSSRSITGFESNERCMPGQRITENWSMLTCSFKQLLSAGQVLGDNTVFFLEKMRFRAEFNFDRQKRMPSYEVGYLEIIGVDN